MLGGVLAAAAGASTADLLYSSLVQVRYVTISNGGGEGKEEEKKKNKTKFLGGATRRRFFCQEKRNIKENEHGAGAGA